MMIKQLGRTIKGCLLASALGVSAVAQAHPLWILPSEFTVSTEEGQGEWITADVSASHTVFGFDKGVPLDHFLVFSPDGDRNALGSYFKGHRRSVFDLYIDQPGTYKIEGKRQPYYFTSYKSGKRDTPKRMMADKIEAKERLPKSARDVSTLLIDMVTATYITNNAPTDLVTEVKGKGLEMQLDTHPNDIVVGEEVEFTMLLDGKPVAGVDVEVTPAGTKYRSERGAIPVTTAKDGKIIFTPEQAGPWLVGADLKSPIKSDLADYQYAIRFVSFEVLPE
ncbi:DUF4198 domain-containing protein [Neptuniibacter sp. QD48_11]|uniref:DUF4198 domain-containing protein n=1 Tax=unclassified Neptuniibacter TaxID=2630693 RepID=UPI0039F6374F